MILGFIIGSILCSSLMMFSFVRQVINTNCKKIDFTDGFLPKKTGKYYIIIENKGKSTVTVDFFNADRVQWKHTKNPLVITRFAECWE